MKTHYINLERSTDRREEFLRTNAHLTQLERFSAIDGRTLDRAQLVQSGFITAGCLYSAGALGLLMSHCHLWQRSIRENVALTVAEDDAMFHADFEPLRDALVAQRPGFDIILWSFNFDAGLLFDLMPGMGVCFAQFDQKAMRQGSAGFRHQALKPNLYRLISGFGTSCYTVSPVGAGKLLEKLLPVNEGQVSQPELGRSLENYGIDVSLNGLYKHIDAQVCFPSLVITKNDHTTSTVQAKPS